MPASSGGTASRCRAGSGPTPDSRALEQVAAPVRGLDAIAVEVRQGGSAMGTTALPQCPPRAKEESSLQRQTMGGGLN